MTPKQDIDGSMSPLRDERSAGEVVSGDPRPSSAARRPDPLIGQALDGRYLVQRLIARGGMGKIYEATQVQLGRIVALKVMDLGFSEDLDPGFKRRFFLEAATCAGLNHPNTVRVFDYGNADDVYFIAMEFIEGRTLLKLIEDEAPLDPMRVVLIARQLVGALGEAHGKGIIHRDLKPSNVLLTRHGDQEDFVKVLDFGLVKLMREDAEEMTKSGLFLGSPNYMSPEQIKSNKLDPRSDLYSVGVILYMALTGHSPFKRDSSVHALLAQLEDPPPPFQTARPGIVLPSSLEWLVLLLLEKDPERRFLNGDELMKALRLVEAECRGELLSLDGLSLERGRVIYPTGYIDGGSVRTWSGTGAASERSLPRHPLPTRTPPSGPVTAPGTAREPSLATQPAADPVARAAERPPRDRRPSDGTALKKRPSSMGPAVWLLAGLAVLLFAALVFLVAQPLGSGSMEIPGPERVPAIQVAPVLLRTEPPGAQVWREGSLLGTTPLELTVPVSQAWRLDLRSPQYVTRVVSVRGGEQLAPIALRPDTPTTPVRSNPVGSPSPPPSGGPGEQSPTPTPNPPPAAGSDLRDPWAG